MTASRARRLFKGTLLYLGIIVATLIVVDLICIALGLFPPTPNYGDAELGWRPAPVTVARQRGVCREFSTGQTIIYSRNEDGVRTDLTREQLKADTQSIKIAVVGDSQTDLCATNSETHAGVLEAELKAHGVPSVVLAYGAGRYSPLQAYLAFRKVLRPYHPQVLVLNIYTGNDLYDILRVDDRPHFVRTDSGYRIAPPKWYTLDNPASPPRSRVLFAARSLADKVGVRPVYSRLLAMRQLGVDQGASLTQVLAYTRDLWRGREPTVGYSDAFTAQMLNQQLFFHHFPATRDESIRRVRALLHLIRGENPGIVLVLSPLPSYQLVGEQPVDSSFVRTLRRLPITYEGGVSEEGELYERLRELAQSEAWVFVDNLKELRTIRGHERLYNDYDYHLLPRASFVVGRAQEGALRDTLRGLLPGPRNP